MPILGPLKSSGDIDVSSDQSDVGMSQFLARARTKACPFRQGDMCVDCLINMILRYDKYLHLVVKHPVSNKFKGKPTRKSFLG